MRKVAAILFVLSTLLLIHVVTRGPGTAQVIASEGGRVGFSGNPASNGGATCTSCHTGGAEPPVVTIKGPVTVTAGATYTYTVRITGGPGVTGGLNVSLAGNQGNLIPVRNETQVIGSELTHRFPKSFRNGYVQYKFRWRAPNIGGATRMYVAGNSTNNKHNMLGDGVATASLGIRVVGSTAPTATPTPTPTPAPTGQTLALVKIWPVAGTTLDTGTPVEFAHAGDNRLFVVEKEGRIWISPKSGPQQSTPFLDIRSRVNPKGSLGLLGLAFHPDYRENGYFYVYYTLLNPRRSRVARFHVSSSNPDVADPGSEIVVLELLLAKPGHVAGTIQFGPDGYLYVATGDGSAGNDEFHSGQDAKVLLGKLLRIDVNGTGAVGCDNSGNSPSLYSIPITNPYAARPGGACPEIWSLGLRQPWRFTFDPVTNDMWIPDVGQATYEEINFQASGVPGGRNFGWSCHEGPAVFNSGECKTGETYVAPVFTYTHNEGDCSVTGGYLYRGNTIPALRGHYIFADYCTGKIRTLSGSVAQPTVKLWQLSPGSNLSQPTAFGRDSEGEMYVASGNGSIYRIVSSAPVTATPAATSTPTKRLTLTATFTATPTATKRRTLTATPTATRQLTLTPTRTGTPANLLTNASFVFSDTAGVSGSREGSEYRITVQTAQASGCWATDLNAFSLRGRTLRLQAAMRKTADMGAYAPYISLQVQKLDGAWVHNYGGIIHSSAVPGGPYLTTGANIAIGQDVKTLRASFCVWKAQPGDVFAREFVLR